MSAKARSNAGASRRSRPPKIAKRRRGTAARPAELTIQMDQAYTEALVSTITECHEGEGGVLNLHEEYCSLNTSLARYPEAECTCVATVLLVPALRRVVH